MQSPPKPQFARWLIEQVETGQYEGLRYVDQNKIRVPWKHNSRKDCNDEDSKIFRAWAMASGKINEFPNDKARWKTNFRCVLNNLSTRFRLIKDNSKNLDDPHKIYEIVNTEYTYRGMPTQNSQEDSDMTPDIYSSSTEFLPFVNESTLLNDFMALDLGAPTEEQLWVETCVQHDPAVLGSYPAAAENIPQFLPDQLIYNEVNPVPVLSPPQQPSLYDLEISIHYRKKEMLKTTLQTNRLQLHYHSKAPEFNAHHLCFPSTEGLLDHKQIEYTNRILNNIQRGLLLVVQENGIYAGRQDKCHVFASTSDPSVAHLNPIKLPKNTMVELLSFDKFANELKQFKENNGSSPEYTINMCFGEKFPDGKPLEKKLIVVKVVPLICRHFYDMAQAEGASSLHSTNVSLQISHNSLFDLINSVFSLPGAEEPTQLTTVPSFAQMGN
ncbi:interferon regulatory factor 7 [Austrofundulus limnaeus]|uniref:Interferon regulatory factor 7 n=1 Tax=Austrofundulus limnaeus TaxID=52670 RepID=A0A2I4AZS9_AUSLI|nr:PREDICTED: interferon regulatory factor 7 [Austrofundulus limnaeus]